MKRKKSYERFHLSGKGSVCVFNEENGWWEYECPEKGKLVLWFDPNEESQRLFLCIKAYDVNGNPLPEKDNDFFIAHAMMFDPMGLFMFPFKPVRMSHTWEFSYDAWKKYYSPEQTLFFSAMVLLYPNRFNIEYLVIPERSELFSASYRKNKSWLLRLEVFHKMEFMKYQFQKKDREVNRVIRKRNQQINEEWDEWERQQAEDWERQQTEKRKRQQKEEQDKKEEEQGKKEESGE